MGYYRCWLAGFALIARPLTKLLRKGAEFTWGGDQKEALEILKVTTAPILVTCFLGAGEVILKVDANLFGWGCVLMQVIEGKRHPILFESGLWKDAV